MDLAILISSSGKSQNIVNGSEKAKKSGISVITVSGFLSDNPLRKLGDLNLWVDSPEYNIVEMTHHIWLLAIIDYLIETKGTVSENLSNRKQRIHWQRPHANAN